MAKLNQRLDPTRTGREAEALESDLRRLIVGQDEAIHHIVNVYQMFLTGMTSPGRPVGNFLFLGPTGSGKTRIVEATAESLVGNPRAVLKIDCAEFQHSHEIAKLIGSPPGYLGHRETHPLFSASTTPRRSRSASFCLTRSRRRATRSGTCCWAFSTRPPSPWETTAAWTSRGR
jgi:hypothetical protein